MEAKPADIAVEINASEAITDYTRKSVSERNRNAAGPDSILVQGLWIKQKK